MGVSSFPQCDPEGAAGALCDAIAELLGDLAYNPLVQAILFQVRALGGVLGSGRGRMMV